MLGRYSQRFVERLARVRVLTADPAETQQALAMPMPTYVNERPVKTGCWTEREDELLAEWQGKYGNRSVMPPVH